MNEYRYYPTNSQTKKKMSHAHEQSASEDVLDLAQVANALHRQKWRLLLTAITIGMISAVSAYIIRDTYESTAKIKIEGKQAPSPLALREIVPGGGNSSAEAEAAIITSRTILIEAINRGNLTQYIAPTPGQKFKELLYRFKSEGGQSQKTPIPAASEIEISSLSVPPELLNEDIKVQYLGDKKLSILFPTGEKVTGFTGSEIDSSSTGSSLNIEKISAPPGTTFIIRQESLEETLDRIESNLSVGEIGKTGIIELGYTEYTPQVAYNVLDAIVESYIESDERYAVNTAQQSLEYIESQIAPALKEIEDAEAALTDYRKRSETINVEFEAEYLLKQMLDVEQKLRENQRPAERRTLESFRDDYRAQLAALPDTQQQTLNLVRDIEVAQTLYLELMKRVQDMRAERVSAEGVTRTIDKPHVPERPVGPNRPKLVIFSICGALALHILLIALGVARRQDLE